MAALLNIAWQKKPATRAMNAERRIRFSRLIPAARDALSFAKGNNILEESSFEHQQSPLADLEHPWAFSVMNRRFLANRPPLHRVYISQNVDDYTR